MSRRLSDDEIVERLKATDTVPEPSPLFWEHAARRVRAAVDAKPPRRSVLDRPARVDGQAGWLRQPMAALLVLPRSPRAHPTPWLSSPATDDRRDRDARRRFVDVCGVARRGLRHGRRPHGLALLAPGETTDRAMQALDAEERAEVATLLHERA